MDETKRCPDCAEDVRTEAVKCRYCAYRFDSGSASSSATASPPAVARSAAVPAQPKVPFDVSTWLSTGAGKIQAGLGAVALVVVLIGTGQALGIGADDGSAAAAKAYAAQDGASASEIKCLRWKGEVAKSVVPGVTGYTCWNTTYEKVDDGMDGPARTQRYAPGGGDWYFPDGTG